MAAAHDVGMPTRPTPRIWGPGSTGQYTTRALLQGCMSVTRDISVLHLAYSSLSGGSGPAPLYGFFIGLLEEYSFPMRSNVRYRGAEISFVRISPEILCRRGRPVSIPNRMRWELIEDMQAIVPRQTNTRPNHFRAAPSRLLSHATDSPLSCR